MPLVTAKCSIVSNTMGGGGGSDYWATILGIDASTSTLTTTRGGILSDNSPIFCTRSSGTAPSEFYFGKLTPSGDLDWDKSFDNQYTGTVGDNSNAGIYTDPSDNFYFTVNFPNASNDDRANILGFSSSGTKIFDEHYGISGNDMLAGNVIGGASGYIRFAMGENNSDDVGLNLVNLSSGTSTFHELSSSNLFITSSMSIAPGNSDSITIVAYHNTTADKIVVTRLAHPIDTQIWTYALSGDGYPSTSVGLGYFTYDSSLNYYLTYRDGDQDTGYLLKFSDSISSPSLAWAAKLTNSSNAIHSIAPDSSGNVYALQYYSTVPNRGYVLYKYNSSGVIQWQRKIVFTVSGTNQTAIPYSIVVDSDDNPVIFGYAPNCHYPSVTTTRGVFIAKLPPDGSGTGTYNFSNNVVMDYSASSITIVSSSGTTSSISTYGSQSQPFGSFSGSPTIAAASMLEEKVAVE